MISRVVCQKHPTLKYQFSTIELRIGNWDATGTGKVQLTQNTLYGNTGGVNGANAYTFNIDPLAEGRYLTLQTINNVYMTIGEIFVHRDF